MRHISIHTLLFVFLAAAVLLISVAPAQADLFCRRHACSNDQLDATNDPLLGDERVQWAPLSEWDTVKCEPAADPSCGADSARRCYEIALYPGQTVVARNCDVKLIDQLTGELILQPPVATFTPYATDSENHPCIGVGYHYIVRACVGTLCSDWGPNAVDGSQDFIEIIGADYACFGEENGARCEQECYPGAPKMYAEIPDCQDPV
jgi:hypothetical protein